MTKINERGVSMNNSSGREGQKKRLSKKEMRQKKKMQRTIGFALTGVMLIFMAVFMGLLMALDVLPILYIVAIVVVLVLILFYVFLSQFTKAHMVGKGLSVVLSIVLAIGSYYVAVTNDTLGKLGDDAKDVMSIVVMHDDEASSINNTSEYLYGINANESVELTQATLAEVKEKLGKEVDTKEYDDWAKLVEALYMGDIQAIVFNEGFRGTMDDYYVTFSTDTKVLDYTEIEQNIEIAVPEKEITDESFTVFISGTDSAGKLGASGHSDVNIIATINPTTKQVLLVTTPRDSWVTLYYGDGTNSGTAKDKLTHSGNKGIACTMSTMEALYGVDIDYYVRLNFTGLEKLVDALGGIDVESDFAFTSYAQTHTYTKGINHMDGAAALIFARERHAFADGDFQRSRNQIKVIKAIADKALSVTMLTNYTGIMDAVSDVLATNVPQDQITKLIKMQLEDMKAWSIKSYTVTGATGEEYCLSVSASPLSIVKPDVNQIALAKAKMEAVRQGKDPDTVTDVTSTTQQ